MSRKLRAAVLAIGASLCVAAIPSTASASDTIIVKYRKGASAAQRAALADRLDLGVDDKGAAGRDPSYGFGRVNLLKAAIG
jgi:hypothetical protein